MQAPAANILESESTIFLMYLDLNDSTEFLLQQDIPDPKLLSETAFQMLNAAPKDVKLVNLPFTNLILVLYILFLVQFLYWKRGGRRFVRFVHYRRIVQ